MSRRKLVVSYGMGLDSTALLVGLWLRGLRPDLILFSDTGGEMPETYAYRETINAWLRSVGFPTVTVVKYAPTRAPYTTLEGKCLANETLPSLAFNGHSCALIFKRDVMVGFLKTWLPEGERATKAIGYDNGKRDRQRSAKADKGTRKLRDAIADRAHQGKRPLAGQWEAANCDFWYALQDWGLAREDLPGLIESAGLPVPPKSSCFFCPARTPGEVVELKTTHPELFERAVAIEDTARNGKHGLGQKGKGTVQGLGLGGWAWSWLRDCKTTADAIALLQSRGVRVREINRP